MQRTWLVLFVVSGIVLAGCSAPGGGPLGSDGAGDVSYPSGWGPEGPDNVTAAVQRADGLVAGEDFVERWVAVEERSGGSGAEYLVVVSVVRVDRDHERLLNERRFYQVDAGLARAVAKSGMEPLTDRHPDQETRVFLSVGGGFRYHQVGNESPEVTLVQSGNYSSAIDQPLPAVLAITLPAFRNASYSNPTPSDTGIRYSMSNVTAFHLENASGSVTVRSDGLVSDFNVSAVDPDSHNAFRYELEVGNVSVETKDWAG